MKLTSELEEFFRNNYVVLVDRYSSAPREFVEQNSGVISKRLVDENIKFSNETYNFLVNCSNPNMVLNNFAFGDPTKIK